MTGAIVTLLTDYGTSDGYVAEVKGVLLRAAPDLTLVDITHDIAPGDIAAAAYVLGRTWRSFPDGTTHLAIVDPGVGTGRRTLAALAGNHRFVAPDNGLLSWVAALTPLRETVALRVPPGASPTFHGRDILALAAARLAAQTPLADLGAPVSDPVLLDLTPIRRVAHRVVGVVVHVDRFGTLVTNITAPDLPRGAVIVAADRDIPLRTTFGDVSGGALVAYIGSGGTLEIAVRDGRADQTLGLGRGDEVEARPG